MLELTQTHFSILHTLKRLRWASNKLIAMKLHPASTGTSQRAAIGRIGKGLEQLEEEGLIECSNPDTKTWKITKKGVERLSAEPLPDPLSD